MIKYIFKATILSVLFCVSCDNANDLLDQHLADGPIIYAAKIDSLSTQSGYNRFRVNIYPIEDVNKSHCIVSWNITEGVKDSVKIEYISNNFDNDLGWYYTVVDLPSSSNIQGNLAINVQNVDAFGNKSLIETGSVYIYGLDYLSSLLNAPINVSPEADKVVFEERIGVVGNLLSYEQNGGNFTEEIFVSENSHPLIDAKPGGIIRTKSRYLMNETDIDMLDVSDYLETKIPAN